MKRKAILVTSTVFAVTTTALISSADAPRPGSRSARKPAHVSTSAAIAPTSPAGMMTREMIAGDGVTDGADLAVLLAEFDADRDAPDGARIDRVTQDDIDALLDQWRDELRRGGPDPMNSTLTCR